MTPPTTAAVTTITTAMNNMVIPLGVRQKGRLAGVDTPPDPTGTTSLSTFPEIVEMAVWRGATVPWIRPGCELCGKSSSGRISYPCYSTFQWPRHHWGVSMVQIRNFVRAHLAVHLGNFPRLDDSAILLIIALICVRGPKCRHCEVSSMWCWITIRSTESRKRR